MDLKTKAREFAKKAHGDQKRKYTGEPYITHTERVAEMMRAYGFRDEVVAAAYLHDVVEDTNVKIEDILTEFGIIVANLVWQVTDQSVPSDGNRNIRKSIDRDWLSNSSSEGASIKLADLIDNHLDINKNDPDFAKVYNGEAKRLILVLEHGDAGLFKRLKELLYETHPQKCERGFYGLDISSPL